MDRTSRVHRSVVAAATLLVVGLTPAVAVASGPQPRGTGAVLEWNAIAFRTISDEGLQPAPVTELYLGFVSVAVYNAVVTVEGGGEPTLPQPPVGRGGSVDVAVATAAYEVLVRFFPASAGPLHDDYVAALAPVPQGTPRTLGWRAGHAAAQAMIASRADDGRGATVPPPPKADFPVATWVETGSGPFAVPWLGFTDPILISSPTSVHVNGPDALTSAAYARDFREVKTLGALEGSDRSARQTRTALFYSDNPVRQYQEAMRGRAVEHRMGVVATARMFAAANAAGADALIVAWRQKWLENFWRPVTAIHRAGIDGNPATQPDPDWAPLVTTPPYPDYTSGHQALSAGVATALQRLLGPGNLDLDITSAAVPGTVRHYDDTTAWLRDTVNARIWLGIHFRDAMEDSRQIGGVVAIRVVDRWFSS
jgi:hypothetical protein